MSVDPGTTFYERFLLHQQKEHLAMISQLRGRLLGWQIAAVIGWALAAFLVLVML